MLGSDGNKRRRLPVFRKTLLCLGLLAVAYFPRSAAAQDQTAQLTVPIKEITSSKDKNNLRPNPLDDDKTVNWMLKDAISAALENNVDISIERKNVRIAELSLRAAQGIYDWNLTASPSFSSTSQPNIGRFSGLSAAEGSTNTTTFSPGIGFDKQVQWGGGSFQTSFTNPRTTSNSAIVSPLYSPDLTFSYTQPLWRNRSIDLNRRNIYVAKKNLSLTDAQFRQQVISVIEQVQQAYWNLGFAINNVKVQSDGVTLAQKQVDDNQKQADNGTLAPLDVVSAKATLETRKQALIQAQSALEQAQNALKVLVVGSTTADLWDKQIAPSDFFEEQPINLNLTEALKAGYDNRPDVTAIKVQREINDVDINYYRNQTKPQIDLVASYGLTGAGGTPVTTLVCPTGTTLNGAVCNPGNLPATPTTSAVNNSFVGGSGTALGNLLSNKYRNATVGVNITLPLGNHTAKANLEKAVETANQTDLQIRKQLQLVEVDVRNAYQAVTSAKSNLDAARLARQYAETQLDGEQKKFASGLSTTFLVLTRQNDLIQARGAEISALSAYNNAIAALQMATGTTLESNNVQIK